METIGHYKKEMKKLDQVLENAAKERQERLDIVKAYLGGQEAGGSTHEEILKRYFEKYKDILDSRLTESMPTKERYEILMETIYKHEILHEAEEKTRDKKAA